MHPFLIHGGDIGFTSTQRSSYDDACATYPISGAAQESDFSLSLHRLHRLLFSAFSTSRAPTVHLGSNARKRPVKCSRLDRTRLDSTRLDSKSTRLSTLPSERVRPEQRPDSPTSMKNVLWISRRPIGGSTNSFAQWPRIVNFKRALFSFVFTFPVLLCLYVNSLLSPLVVSFLSFFFFPLFLLLPHACLAKPTGHRCSKPLYLTRNGPSYTRTAHLSILLLVCIATTRVYFFLIVGSLALW